LGQFKSPNFYIEGWEFFEKKWGEFIKLIVDKFGVIVILRGRECSEKSRQRLD
jgi:hypothetical protein